MNCDAFELQLNNVFDSGLAPEADAELADHARQCAGCRELQQTYVQMLSALSALPTPQPAAGFAARVVAACKVQPAATAAAAAPRSDGFSGLAAQLRLATPWAMALAAGLLIVVWGFRAPPPSGGSAGGPDLATAQVEPSAAVVAAVDRSPPPPASLREVALLVPGLSLPEPSPAEQDLASADESSLSAHDSANRRDWTQDLSSGLKPLARSTSGALDLILGALTATEPRADYPNGF